MEFDNYTPAEMIDYILTKHHGYVRDALPVLWEIGRKVAEHHGDEHPELVQLEIAVQNEARDLLGHMEKEERMLFPAIKKLVAFVEPEVCSCSVDARGPDTSNMDFVEQCVDRMLREHAGSTESLAEFRRLTHNYEPPAGACNSYRFLFEKLREFDLDLREHIRLENEILFPKAVSLLKMFQSY